ncbi:PREDICTED: LIM domain transcription factor LMO4 isoform X2 [Odobenus rosmarus divergens]|uniref:LIM domain transcription factor LMO4 isoform X2 n=1 Tax=Odobenus rosmarus divergens TaxID=9708 RepID=A0A2U3WJJ5_ODORO|nr:PREDICTED: LIM domain transcription factor LMO4 isoform X2 [Odobenus rosmarus divergens]
MVNPGSSSQPPPVTAGSLSWKRCAGCGGKIADRFLLYAMDSYWHSRCLKCSCCQAQLGDIGTSCYTKSGMILCRNDYIRSAKRSEECRMRAFISDFVHHRRIPCVFSRQVTFVASPSAGAMHCTFFSLDCPSRIYWCIKMTEYEH